MHRTGWEAKARTSNKGRIARPLLDQLQALDCRRCELGLPARFILRDHKAVVWGSSQKYRDLEETAPIHPHRRGVHIPAFEIADHVCAGFLWRGEEERCGVRAVVFR
jgi:hypothetical protein